MEVVKTCLRENNLRPDQISNVLLVGGSSAMRKIKEMLGEFFG
jgi:molecular chaperone DnaK (HSP70)